MGLIVLKAIEAGDTEKVRELGNAPFKMAFNAELMKRMQELIKLQSGIQRESRLLGTLRQGNCDVELWKLTFSDNSDDVVLRVVSKNNMIVGIIFQ